MAEHEQGQSTKKNEGEEEIVFDNPNPYMDTINQI